MAIFGAMRGRAGGRGRQARFVPMAPGEREVARESAVYRPTTSKAAEGELVVTTMRLVFTPDTTHDATRAISWVLDRPGDPDGATQAEQVRGVVREHGFGRLAEFDRTRAGRAPSRSCPPTFVVTDMAGIETEIGVLASRSTAAGSTENISARDRLLGEIVALLPQMH